jgi:bifunctional UDP-N-acetylglucosamine pyrophosphorylase/glucosamine-1-phosphate N-acetyltransferase
MQEEKNYVVRGLLLTGENVFIDIGCIIEGHVVLCDNVKIGPYCVIKNSVIEDNTEVLAFSYITDTNIGENCVIGPYARLRDDVDVGDRVVLGNFVEVKKSFIGDDTHAKHHNYLGDASIGKRVNIGCGAITCNYDGVNKHVTIVEDDAFIGADTQLVAPVRVGEGAKTAAGSVITENVPAKTLAIRRAQLTIKALKGK